jgi:hypothetical protein
MLHHSDKKLPPKDFRPSADGESSSPIMPQAEYNFEDCRDTYSLDQLSRRQAVEIAIDTEFQGPHTLSIQAATRIGKDIVVQIYRSKDIPDLPGSFQRAEYLPPSQYDRFCRKTVLRPIRPITSDISPGKLLLDLFGIGGPRTDSRARGKWIVHDKVPGEAKDFLEPCNADWDTKHGKWAIPTIHIHMIGHFLTADLCRVFGSFFQTSLFNVNENPGAYYDHRLNQPLTLEGSKLLRITNSDWPYGSPEVEFIQALNGDLYRITLETRDTMLPFGSASLDRHCQTFLGFGKSPAVSQKEKERMLDTFATKPADAYGYALADAVNTLLVYEAMHEKHEQVYHSFGVDKNIPDFPPTMGSRVSRFVLEVLARYCQESENLSRPGALKRLLRRGGAHLFIDNPRASRYGVQTGGTHGGLLLSRSPTCFWHEAPGQLRDVDMSG